MITLPDLTDELLRELGQEIGQCDFTADRQKEFLARIDSCDVQAAPGNGKTTLLVAKLALLSRTWTSRRQGVCVISHTNAARKEVEKRLSDHPRAAAFLSYPHFIGTVTAFVDQFIALPYLRGLGWPIRRIDDDVFAAIATARIHSVKGRTVDSILIVETELFKGSAANQKVMDLAAVLPQAFGIGAIDFDANEAHLSAATNVFVGATRARSLLALAVRKAAVTADLIERAREQGWNVRDVTGA